jgi:Leucine-rich repeat (LRR) protein
LETLPKEIDNLQNLKSIFLARNQLKKLPKELRNLVNCKIYAHDNLDLILPAELNGWENISL